MWFAAKVPGVDEDEWNTSGPMVRGLVEGGWYWEARWFAVSMYRMCLHASICGVGPEDPKELKDPKDSE